MASLRELAAKIGALTEANSNRHHSASRFVKLGLLGGGGLAVAVSLAVEVAKANGEFTTWTFIGVVGAVAVFLGTAFLIFSEQDPATALETARQAIEEARDRRPRVNLS